MKPLQGCRVLDLGIITAGAATSALLADLGAEVLKIESPSYRDPFRVWNGPPLPGQDEGLPPFFRMTNRNKLSVAIDLKQPEGREVFLRLAAKSDIVVENFSRGVMQRLGLGIEVLRAARPEIILASISSQGETGPDANFVSFGSTLEALAGMAWGTGYAGGPPVVTGLELNYPDQVVALFAGAMILAAWRARQAGQGGAHLDLSQRELTSFLAADAFLAGVPRQDLGPPSRQDLGPPPRQGNAQAPYSVQDCFLCQDGAWLAVSLLPGQETALAAATGAAGDTAPRAMLEGWAARHGAAEAAIALRAAGLIAAPVLDAAETLAAQGGPWRWAMQSMPDGDLVKGFPFQAEDVPFGVDLPAAQLGTHTAEVLRRVGGFSDAEIAGLAHQGAVYVPALVAVP